MAGGMSNSGGGGGMMRMPLAEFYAGLERERGLAPGYLARTRAVESGNGRNLQNPNSSAGGPFQFIDKTAKAVGLKNRFDEYESATKAADLAQQNAGVFQKAFGRVPTGPELYGLHQQGSKGYVDLVKGIAPGGDAQRLNSGAGQNASGFLATIHSKFNNAKIDPTTLGLPAGAAVADARGPTVAAAANANAPLPGAQGPSLPIAVANAPAPAPAAPQTFNGGLLGLARGSDYTGQGADRSTMDKIGDTVKSDAFGGAMKGLATAMAPTPQAAPERPIQINPDNVNVPQLQFMQMLQRKRTGGGLI